MNNPPLLDVKHLILIIDIFKICGILLSRSQGKDLKTRKGFKMKFVVTKASSDDCMTIRDFSTVESLITFMKEQENPLILDDNFWYKENVKSVPRFPKIDPNELVSIPYEIRVYDAYIE